MLDAALRVELVERPFVARLASAWGLSRSLTFGTGRKVGAGLTALVVVACSLLILYRLLVVS